MKSQECSDKKCPIHGTLSTRGQSFTGVVVSAKMDGTCVIERKYTKKLPKYNRYLHASSRASVHNPACIKAKKGDIVEVIECKKLSKTVSATIISKSNAKEEKPKEKKEEVNG